MVIDRVDQYLWKLIYGTCERFYNQTSGHRFRAKNDVQYAFAYNHYVIENDLIKSTVFDEKSYGAYIPSVNFEDSLKNYLQPKFFFPFYQKYLWICMQAGTSPENPNGEVIRNQGTGSINWKSWDRSKSIWTGWVLNWYQSIYPKKSQFEIGEKITEYEKYDLQKNNASIQIKSERRWLWTILGKQFLIFIFIPVSLCKLLAKIFQYYHAQRKYKTYVPLKT